MGFPVPSFKVNIMHNVSKLVKLCQPTHSTRLQNNKKQDIVHYLGN